MRYSRLASLSLAGRANAGSATLRKESESPFQPALVRGRTTNPEVAARFGAPAAMSRTKAGLELWSYGVDLVRHATFEPRFAPASAESKGTLAILFDQNGVVKKFTVSDSLVDGRTDLGAF